MSRPLQAIAETPYHLYSWRKAAEARFAQVKQARLASAALACEKLINQATTRLSQVCMLCNECRCNPGGAVALPRTARQAPFASAMAQ